MKYCVLVKISKRFLKFWYQIDGGIFNTLSINDSTSIPLYFYVNGNDFKFGESAKDRYLLNDPYAITDYFDLVKDPSKYFSLHGDSKPIKQLLYFVIENHLSHFIKTILFKNVPIESFRNNFCLRFWFDSDIETQEKVLVENLFKEAGYENVAEINVENYQNQVISKELNSSIPRLFISSLFNDLYIKLYSSNDFKILAQEKLDDVGADPRAKILAKLILEDIKEASPFIHIEEEIEIPYIINHCVNLLSKLSPIMRNEIELSNGNKTEYKIRLRHLEDRLMFNRGIEDKVIPKLEYLLSVNSLSNNKVEVVLLGDETNTPFFIEKLKRKFPNVHGYSSIIELKTLKEIFIQIASNGYQLISKANVPPIIGLPDSSSKNIPLRPPKPTRPPIEAPPPKTPQKIPSAPTNLKVPPKVISIPNITLPSQTPKSDAQLPPKSPPSLSNPTRSVPKSTAPPSATTPPPKPPKPSAPSKK